MHISTNNLTPGKAKLPTVAQYKRDVGALVKRYKPLGVTEWGTWNEANHTTQPTFRSARRAAQFYVAMKGFAAVARSSAWTCWTSDRRGSRASTSATTSARSSVRRGLPGGR